MVDRIDKIGQNFPEYRVDETADSTEEEQKRGQGGDDEENTPTTPRRSSEQMPARADAFSKFGEKTDWKIVFEQSELWNQDVSIVEADIDQIYYLGINLKTDPSLLNIRIRQKDGTEILSAFLSIPRHQGLVYQSLRKFSLMDHRPLLQNGELHCAVAQDQDNILEEITRVVEAPLEKTLSQTLKMFVSQRTWAVRLGIRDPVTGRINQEVLAAYVTASVVALALVLGMIFLTF